MNLTEKQAQLIDSADRLMFFCQSRPRRVGVASKAADRVATLARKHDSSAGFWLAGALTELRHGIIRENAGHTAEMSKHYAEMARQFESFKRAVARS
jgi:hypothetical protein